MENLNGMPSIKYLGEGILNSFEKQIALARKLEDVYKNRPDPKNFIGAMAGTKHENSYTAEAIQKEIEYVEKTKAKIEESNKKRGQEVLSLLESGFSLGEMMQAMIIDRINKGMFPGFKAVMTSERDDLHGMDAILKAKGSGYLGASFDFTISGNSTEILDKLEKNWSYGIEKHEIPTVKFFEDPDTHKKGSLLVPKFIIGGSKKEIEFFTYKYLNGEADDLDSHPFVYLMIKQIDMQLDAAIKFFVGNKDDSSFDFIHKEYLKIKSFINRLKEDVDYKTQVNSQEFLKYKSESIAYKTMKKFFLDK